MQTNNASQFAFFNPRALIAFVLCFAGALLAMFSFAATPSNRSTPADKHANQLSSNGIDMTAGGWTIVPSPNTSTTQGNILRDVTCISASDCWAVGYYDAGSYDFQTLIERWDGTAWAIVTSPNPNASPRNFLNGVTCVSASDCWAVGSYVPTGSFYPQTLIHRWNGTSWSIVPSPNTLPTQPNYLHRVTCASASDCLGRRILPR